MINSLSIKNYALIDDLNLEFGAGFIVITGETGSGKSILLEAMELLAGARADMSAVRSGSAICSISGSFTYQNAEISAFLDELGIPVEDNTVVIRRVIESAEGRSKAFINDAPVNVSTLQTLGRKLINFHSQDEKYELNSPQNQLAFLDSRIDENAPRLAKAASVYEEISELKRELESLNLSEAERERKMDLYSFQIEEINQADLRSGDEEKIAAELPALKNAEKISEVCALTDSLLYSGDNPVLSQLSKVQKNIENLISLGTPAQEALSLVQQSYYQIDETRREIEDIAAKTDINPQTLNAALEREELIKKMKKKYGRDISEILQYRDKIQKEFEALNNSEGNIKNIEAAIEEKTSLLTALSAEISEARKKEAANLCGYVKDELAELDIPNAVFEISFDKKPLSASGFDKIEFMFCANKGEEILPLRNCASGGEMSRVMLALELSSRLNADQTAVFDEIDAGTGGKAGGKIGKKLETLSKEKQVFSVTHLAQVCAFSDSHIKIYKDDNDLRTRTKAEILPPQEHIKEIARMISGEQVTESALSHAKNLIGLSKTEKR
ncbi:MAG: DNA repair protein RecN [Elusimicrobiota bacterium]|jgi:DNA repair protein RecN (Recombination protein N)|nr:DNA repair protein RecN [Elusimicrobiota bacterium]